jgi:hypothetical protein
MTMTANGVNEEESRDTSLEVGLVLGQLAALTDQLNGLADSMLAELEDSGSEDDSPNT